MGFLDVLGGGGSIDTGDAVKMAQRSQRTVGNLYGENKAALQPFIAGGTGAYKKLSGLLGIADGMVKPKDQLYIDMARQYLPPTAKLVNGSGAGSETYIDNQTRMRYFVDPTTGVIQQKSIDAPGSSWKTIHDGSGLSAAVNSAYDSSMATAKGGEDFGSLLDPFTLNDYQQSPNYQFNLQEGQKAIDRAAAARGDYNSPAAIQELSKYSQDLASNEFLNSYQMDAQNKGRAYDMLMGSTGVGQTATGQQVAVNQDFGGEMTDLNAQIAQLGLAGQADKAAKRQSAFGNLTSLASLAGSALGSPIASTSIMGRFF